MGGDYRDPRGGGDGGTSCVPIAVTGKIRGLRRATSRLNQSSKFYLLAVVARERRCFLISSTPHMAPALI